MGRLEMDIISANKTHLVFTEVKTRRSDLNNTSRPASAVNKDKKSYLISFATSYVKSVSKKHAEKQIRIDVCEVLVYQKGKKLKVNDINYIENAITR
jgi:Holliday junction resolvase-like predicted endonuclease